MRKLYLKRERALACFALPYHCVIGQTIEAHMRWAETQDPQALMLSLGPDTVQNGETLCFSLGEEFSSIFVIAYQQHGALVTEELPIPPGRSDLYFVVRTPFDGNRRLSLELTASEPFLTAGCHMAGPADTPAEKTDVTPTAEEPRVRSFHTVIKDDGIPLHAKLDLPDTGREKLPLVIIIHGFTGNMEERHITAVSGALNEIGCATLRVDMYGHGQSGGSFRSHTLYKWLSNIMTVVEYAEGMDFISDLYLCGHSQGGLTVMLAAAMMRDRIRGLIPMSPGICIPDGARQGMLLGMAFDPDRIPAEIRSPDGWTMDGNYIRVAQTIHAEDAITRYKGPVLLIHGTADETIPAACSVEAQKAYANAELKLIPGDTHCYDHHLDLAVDAVKQWMLKRI